MSRPLHQGGSALLIALVAVALAAVLAVGLIERTQRDLARTAALLANERSWQYAMGMDALARQTLNQARANGLDPASLSGVWTEPFPVPGGFVQARLIDQQGRFNLNALGHPDELMAGAAEQVLLRLLQQLGLPQMLAGELREWQRESGPGAARVFAADAWYGAQIPPYQRAGMALAHVSELRWLRALDETAWERLQPYVTVLPMRHLRVNINATSAELLSALIEGLEPEQARRLLADGPFSDWQQLSAHPLLADRLSVEHQSLLGVESAWFIIQARVVLDDVDRDYHRLIDDSGSGYDFRWFSQGPP